jgi:hypothetical protein
MVDSHKSMVGVMLSSPRFVFWDTSIRQAQRAAPV